VSVTVIQENKQITVSVSPVNVTARESVRNVVSVSAGIIGQKGDKGDKGDTGPAGSVEESFESVSKNIKSWNAALVFTTGQLTSIVYTSGPSTITKTFNYTSGVLTSLVLSGDTPSGIQLTKTLGYVSGSLSTITYS
jgi:hypothetical protein